MTKLGGKWKEFEENYGGWVKRSLKRRKEFKEDSSVNFEYIQGKC